MASITKTTNRSGEEVYTLQASGGRGRRVKRNWRPEPGWSARTIQRELHKFAAQLENDLSSGAVSTKKESDEQARTFWSCCGSFARNKLDKRSAAMSSPRTRARILCTHRAPPDILRNSVGDTV